MLSTNEFNDTIYILFSDTEKILFVTCCFEKLLTKN
jgi:hypothetical protein